MRAKWTDLAVEAAGGALRENGLSRTVVKVENEESAQKLGRRWEPISRWLANRR